MCIVLVLSSGRLVSKNLTSMSELCLCRPSTSYAASTAPMVLALKCFCFSESGVSETFLLENW